MTASTENASSRPGRELTITSVVAIGIVAVDLTAKRIGEARLDYGAPRWLVDGWVGLERTSNSGVAFSLFEGGRFVWVFIAVAFAGLAWIVGDAARRATSIAGLLPAALIAAGAFGNLIDRAGDGRVTDLIAVGPWPRFNIADSSLTIGLVLLLVQTATTKGHDSHDGRRDQDANRRDRPAG